MKKLSCIGALVLMAFSPVAAFAGNGKSKSGHCPPGLAKKAVPCVPPGQVNKLYREGDRIDQDYTWINDPNRYGLKRGGNYVRAGDYVYRIDPDTRKVLNLIGAVADILY
ncbi:hypothetical protein HW561_04810 [Rhodobacteraceae bacterium B1Z28]|uniref:Nickel/cobalt transporter regulator n=1 Tax=Ruegeria haliotis TaxID=2747601 RepID=A0ABX2PLV7_9RHOB|nr:hypothetical protein [Ruegeria haliotis]NVO55108.1 hypothetical protein [Ruegeria haliotis]